MHIHFIAIGGSAMHNLALALHQLGYIITGSDDQIFEPSKSRLKNAGLLPDSEGWFPNKISKNIDAIILGMHARANNPELIKAQELGLKIYSYPEFLYEHSKHKQRVVIGGSHGKTSITAMVMHVLKEQKIDFDYMVGAQIKGFNTMVRLTEKSKIMVLEGDEYLTSPIDLKPKFHWYKPNIALISGIAWDHINVFPTFENYVEQFKIFIQTIEPNGHLVFFTGDDILRQIALFNNAITVHPYNTPKYKIKNGNTFLITNHSETPLEIFGEHNLQNLAGAQKICVLLGIKNQNFIDSIQSFKGAARRLEKIAQNNQTIIFKDFAHSPSKLSATVAAVKNQFHDKKVIAVIELHTFSSLNKQFLLEYNGCMDLADEAIVYFNPKTVQHKKLELITVSEVAQAFGTKTPTVYTQSDKLFDDLNVKNLQQCVLLIMTSGNFDGVNIDDWATNRTNV